MQIRKADEEKPFLQHLDDLRSMLVRMIVTLLIATCLCFVYAQELMSIIRYPVDQVWSLYEASHLASDVSTEEWARAKSQAYVMVNLDEPAKKAFLKHSPQRMRELMESAVLLKAARQLDEAQRTDFIRDAASSEEVERLALELEEAGAVLAEDSGRGALKMMGAFQPSEGFMLSMKLAFYAGVIVSSPLLLFFLLQFIVPGLLQHERRVLYKSMFFGLGLFLIGVSFSYFVVLPRVLTFFYEYSLDFGIANEWRIGYYVSFATQLILLFGLAFELPIVVYPFIRLGVLSYELMSSTRRYAAVGIAILAAVITPTPDALTMMLMAVPMYALYELCILMAWHEKRRKRQQEEEGLKAANSAYGLDES